jgi:hypothetical protein
VSGSLRYRILEPEGIEHVLTPDRPGIIEPEVEHAFEVFGPVRFFIQFLRRDTAPAK